MVEPLPDTGLPQDTLATIGCVVVEWAYLEWTLDDYIRKLLTRPEAVGLQPRHLRIRFSERLSLYRKLATICYEIRRQKAANRAAAIIDAVKGDREIVSHFMLGEMGKDLMAFGSHPLQIGGGAVAKLVGK